MLFNSIDFLIFFPVVTALYFLFPHKFRWFLLLAASCYFYMYFVPVYILILFGTIVIDYIAGRVIEDAQPSRKKLFLTISIIANVGILAVFKYYNFFIDNINTLLHHFQLSEHNLPLLKILLPIGLSFHTFQAMSYTIEVYRGNQKAEKHFGIYALYVMFYPQLVAGPIERPQNVLHQFHEEKYFDYNNVVLGLTQIVWGMFKKVVIADRIALLTSAVFGHPDQYPGISLLIAACLFSFQIYYDFSGYSDIALGCARVMGFRLMKNFDRPYAAKNISEFWSRWHISLSTWFRDYLYIPLGGNRVSIPRWYFNLFIVFLVSGFWHGANWTFIIWGALHGFYLVAALVINRLRGNTGHLKRKNLADPAWKKAFHIALTFALVTVAWIFFRAANVHDAFYIIRKLPSALSDLMHIAKTRSLSFMKIWNIENFASIAQLLVCIGLIAAIELLDYCRERYNLLEVFRRQPRALRWTVYYVAIFVIIFMGIFENQQFIYFQF